MSSEHAEHAHEKDPRDVEIPPKAWRDESLHTVADNIGRGVFLITVVMTVAYCAAVIYVIFW